MSETISETFRNQIEEGERFLSNLFKNPLNLTFKFKDIKIIFSQKVITFKGRSFKYEGGHVWINSNKYEFIYEFYQKRAYYSLYKIQDMDFKIQVEFLKVINLIRNNKEEFDLAIQVEYFDLMDKSGITIKCPNCKKENKMSFKFCKFCACALYKEFKDKEHKTIPLKVEFVGRFDNIRIETKPIMSRSLSSPEVYYRTNDFKTLCKMPLVAENLSGDDLDKIQEIFYSRKPYKKVTIEEIDEK